MESVGLTGVDHWWRRLVSRVVAFALACVIIPSGAAWAMQSLPVVVPEQLEPDNILAQEMTALMQDYAHRLTLQRVLSWYDFETLQTREWTPHLGKFREACRQQSGSCVLILQSQLKALRDDLEQAGNAPRTDRTGAVWSALSDLCEMAPVLGSFHARVFNLCGGQVGTAGYAAVVWLELGYDELFLSYYATHENKRQTTIAWLAEKPASDQAANVERQRLERDVNNIVAAKYAEAMDRLPFAASSWLTLLMEAITKGDDARMLLASLNLARGAFHLEGAEQGANWQRVAGLIIEQRPELKTSIGCGLHTERMRVELAQTNAMNAPADGVAVIKELIEHDCGFTVITLEHALANLLAGRPARTATILEMALKACVRTGQCASSRVRHLEDVFAIAQGHEPELLRQSERWLGDSRAGRFNALERKIVWALANALATSAAGQGAAQKLYAALDDQIQDERSLLTGVNASSLKNLARYDELSRLRAKTTVQQGEVLWLERTESLRAQSLLRRLRLKRWQHEFAGVRDDAARARLDARLAVQAGIRDFVAGESAGKTMLHRPLLAAIQADTAGNDALAQELYIQELASRQAEAGGASRRSSWLSAGSIDLVLREQNKAAGALFTSLGADEAYLSWLRVPGGYVGTLAVPDPQRTGRWGTHRLVGRFIAVSSAMSSTLELYRQLLQSGAGASRGARVVATPQSDAQGLLLKGVPVWRQTDGSYAASSQADIGAVRAQVFSELGDAIYKMLLGPFQSDFKAARRLVISPDGELAYLPFETLSNGGVPILDGIDIAYVQSLAVHEELTARARKPRAGGTTLLTLADPDYSMSAGASPSAVVVPGALAAMRWQPLPGTRAESAEMLRLFPAAQQRLGAQASRKQLNALQRSGELAKYRVLHFATHGYVDDERSALVLSMADGPGQGYLQDTDVLDLQLDSDLVLLSACDTGIGRNVSGEGVMGLPYAFLLAGNSNTLMSLWPVDDKGAAAFMAAFMAKVSKGADLLVALNDTKREFAGGGHGKAFADPRIWAAFVQYGVGIVLQP